MMSLQVCQTCVADMGILKIERSKAFQSRNRYQRVVLDRAVSEIQVSQLLEFLKICGHFAIDGR